MFRFWTSQGFGKFGLVSWRSTYSSCGFYSSSRIFLSQTSLVPTVLLVNLQGPPDIEKTQLAKIHGPGPVGPGHVYECGGSRLWEGGSGSAWIATSEHVFLHGTTPSLFESKELIKWQFQKWYHHRALCPKAISFFCADTSIPHWNSGDTNKPWPNTRKWRLGTGENEAPGGETATTSLYAEETGQRFFVGNK